MSLENEKPPPGASDQPRESSVAVSSLDSYSRGYSSYLASLQTLFSQGNVVLLQSLASGRGLTVSEGKGGRLSGRGIRDAHCKTTLDCNVVSIVI